MRLARPLARDRRREQTVAPRLGTYALVIALFLGAASGRALAASRFVCKDAGPCFCLSSTMQYFSQSNGPLTITCINSRTYSRTYYDSVSQAEWLAARAAGPP